MKYQHETGLNDYSDYAGGKVFYSFPGQAAFPVRLTSEIFLRCVDHLEADRIGPPYVVYDPCCGTAVHLAALAYLHWTQVDTIIGSDIDQKALEFAAKNLSLLTLQGLDQRISELTRMVEAYSKDSHREALISAQQLRSRLTAYTQSDRLQARVFRADATMPLAEEKLLPERVDIVLTDVPYGRRSSWVLAGERVGPDAEPIRRMLSALHDVLPEHAVVAVATGNRQKIDHEHYARLKQLRSGKRRITFLRPR